MYLYLKSRYIRAHAQERKAISMDILLFTAFDTNMIGYLTLRKLYYSFLPVCSDDDDLTGRRLFFQAHYMHIHNFYYIVVMQTQQILYKLKYKIVLL